MVIAFYDHGPEGVSPMDGTNNPCFGSLHILLVEQATPSGGFFYGGERGLGSNPLRQICQEQI